MNDAFVEWGAGTSAPGDSTFSCVDRERVFILSDPGRDRSDGLGDICRTLPVLTAIK